MGRMSGDHRPASGRQQEAELGYRPATVLLVENDPAASAAATRILRGAGYGVVRASDSGWALRLAVVHRTPIDLLLIDLVLPGMDGARLAELIDRARLGVPAVFMSGDDERERVGGSHAVEYRLVRKPFDRGALLGAVREALDARRGEAT
jgi:two-component system, cell cycle sensor histidine kinase and response regulator CckA